MKAAKHWRSCVIVELPKPPNTVRALLRGRPVDHATFCHKLLQQVPCMDY